MNLDGSFTTQVSNYYNWIQDLEYSSSGCNQIRFDFFSCSQSRKNLAHMENILYVKKTSVSLGSLPILLLQAEFTSRMSEANAHTHQSEYWLSSNMEELLRHGWATVKCWRGTEFLQMCSEKALKKALVRLGGRGEERSLLHLHKNMSRWPFACSNS